MRRISLHVTQYILCSLLISWQVNLFAEFSKEQLQWLESEAEHPTQNVNEGQLEFISVVADKAEHEQSMQIAVTEETIDSGWAVIKQCHKNLDQVEKLEIVFHRHRVRNLQVLNYKNIGKAWAVVDRVKVRNIQSGSFICLQAESLIFRENAGQARSRTYEMVNGPFMRRFFDGYYPLTLSLDISYPVDRLRLVSVSPEAQPGWKIRYDAGRIFLNGRFEGKLSTRIRFSPKK